MRETLAVITDSNLRGVGMALCIRSTGVAHRNQSAGMGQNRKFWPGESSSLRNFTLAVRKVSSQDFLPVLGNPWPKITNRSFWPACHQNLRSFLLRCDHGSNFQNFDLERIRPMVLKVSFQDFLLILGGPRPKITNRSFWPSSNQMVLLTGVRPKPGFGPFDRHATISLSRYFWPMVLLHQPGCLSDDT